VVVASLSADLSSLRSDHKGQSMIVPILGTTEHTVALPRGTTLTLAHALCRYL